MYLLIALNVTVLNIIIIIIIIIIITFTPFLEFVVFVLLICIGLWLLSSTLVSDLLLLLLLLYSSFRTRHNSHTRVLVLELC
jgi:ABC-type nickel/cobalt efflux system permease component RcnA